MELRLDGQAIVILRKNLGRKGAFEMVEYGRAPPPSPWLSLLNAHTVMHTVLVPLWDISNFHSDLLKKELFFLFYR